MIHCIGETFNFQTCCLRSRRNGPVSNPSMSEAPWRWPSFLPPNPLNVFPACIVFYWFTIKNLYALHKRDARLLGRHKARDRLSPRKDRGHAHRRVHPLNRSNLFLSFHLQGDPSAASIAHSLLQHGTFALHEMVDAIFLRSDAIHHICWEEIIIFDSVCSQPISVYILLHVNCTPKISLAVLFRGWLSEKTFCCEQYLNVNSNLL